MVRISNNHPMQRQIRVKRTKSWPVWLKIKKSPLQLSSHFLATLMTRKKPRIDLCSPPLPFDGQNKSLILKLLKNIRLEKVHDSTLARE